jgi:hypothetical protein
MIIIDLRRNPPPSPISEYIIEEKISEIPIKTINWMKFVSTVDQGFQKNNGRKVRAGPNCLNRHYQFISEYLSFY